MENPEQWSEEEAAEWFNKREWLPASDLKPDASINKQELATAYHRNPDRWDKAFAFLVNTDLDTIAVGTHEIDGKDVYAIVSEYNSKNPEDAQFESHKTYTDLQYVVSGEEQIGLTTLDLTSEKIPYDSEKDIAFYNAESGKTLMATPGTFFLFFPGDAHRPGMKVNDNVPVRKLVIKIKN